MDRWLSRSSSGRLTPARSRCSWSVIVAALERDPWLVVPNRLDVDRVERDLIRRRPALSRARSGTFDDLFRAFADDAAKGGDRIGYAARLGDPTRRCRSRARRPALVGLDAGFADTLLQTIGELESAARRPVEVSRCELRHSSTRTATSWRASAARSRRVRREPSSGSGRPRCWGGSPSSRTASRT
jgi:hypothetical protein